MLLLPSPIPQPSILSTITDPVALAPPLLLFKSLILQLSWISYLANVFNQPSEIIIKTSSKISLDANI